LKRSPTAAPWSRCAFAPSPTAARPIALTELLAKALGVPKAKVRILSGTTSRLKQIAVDGDPAKLGEALRKLTAAKPV
jgi:Uncharacterised ACR, YggU family COG1872